MKRTIVALMLVFLSAGCASLPFKNEPNGFRNITWGADVATIPGLHYASTDPSYGGVKLYAREGDELVMGSAKLDKIEYGFWDNRFTSVTVYFKGYENFAGVKNAISEKFGEGVKTNPYLENYFWQGPITTMMLRYSEVLGIGDFYLHSNAISKEEQRHEKAQAQKGAAKDF